MPGFSAINSSPAVIGKVGRASRRNSPPPALTLVHHTETATSSRASARKTNAAKKPQPAKAASDAEVYRRRFEESPEGFLITDHAGTLLDANPAAFMLFHNAPNELLGMPLYRYFSEKDWVTLKKIIPTGAPRPRRPEEVVVRLRLSGERSLFVAVTVARSGMQELFWAFRDVTARRLEEERVRAVNQDLEKRVHERTTALALANQFKTTLLQREQQPRTDAERANNAKDRFLAILSHELRTPLTPVLATVSAMLHDPNISADLRCTLDMVRRNVEVEARLIDDLLDLTRVARGRMELQRETIDVHLLIKEVIGICSTDLENKRLKIVLDFQASRSQVTGDVARLQQVFWNLLRNAIKFTPPGGTVTFRSSNRPDTLGVSDLPTPDGGQELVVAVQDTGIGIDPSALQRIFEAFEQAEDSITKSFGGLGLGLAIAKAILMEHRGHIWAESPGRGHGSTFTVALPALEQTAAYAALPASPRGPALNRKLRILLVEDHDDTRKVMAKLLGALGHTVTTADCVENAKKVGTQGQYDVLISDLGLPDGSGLDVRRGIPEERFERSIALSGYGMDEDIRRSQEAGFDAHLTKPVNLQKLEALLAQVLGQ